MSNINNVKNLEEQYGKNANLNRRIYVKKRFSVGRLSWADFLLRNFQLKPNQRVLELGCGNAVFWKAASGRIPAGVKLILSDMSPGMLEAAKSNTDGCGFIDGYAEIDAQKIPYDDNSFDIVVANYMLYHVPDIDMALKEISRVLKPGGLFFAAAFGKNNLIEVDDVFKKFDDRIEPVVNDLCDSFGLENGTDYLKKRFGSVNIVKYENGLHITESEPLADYFLSYHGIGNVGGVITDDNIPLFREYIAEIFNKKGYFDITQDEGLFISENPKDK